MQPSVHPSYPRPNGCHVAILTQQSKESDGTVRTMIIYAESREKILQDVGLFLPGLASAEVVCGLSEGTAGRMAAIVQTMEAADDLCRRLQEIRDLVEDVALLDEIRE